MDRPPVHDDRRIPPARRRDVPGEYPVVDVDFHDGTLPIEASPSAYTPFVPLDLQVSGIPCVVMEYTFENSTSDPVPVSASNARKS